MKALLCLLLAVCSVVECRKLFVPSGPHGSSMIGQSRSVNQKVWRVGELGRKSKKDLQKYLSTYGYSGTYSDGKAGSEANLAEGIKDFQYFVGLQPTGRLDQQTVKMINTDRCGLKDPNKRQERKKSGRSGRMRRYNHQGSAWRHFTLTWQYLHDPWQKNKAVSKNDVRRVMQTAMNKWQAVTNIQFKEVRTPFTVGGANEPDILVRFTRGSHSEFDPFPFDGQGGTLAHAFYPLNNRGAAGDVHFDDDERYTINGARPGYEIDLEWVATHELGHSLGLDHSRDQSAIMYPYYVGYKPGEQIQLGSDDRLGIQLLYGGKIKKKVPKCPTKHITAVWDSQKDGEPTYLVLTKDKKLYHVSKNNKGVMGESIPKSTLYKMPYAIDAAYQTNFGREGDPLYDVIFTSQGYYVYQGSSRINGPHAYIGGNYDTKNFCKQKNPRDRTPLKITFPAQVRKIDAVMKWQRNNKVYFFTGNSYYRYDEKKKMFDCGYPRLIKPNWQGVPENIDAAYSSRGKNTFFIKGNKIYHIDDDIVRVHEGNPKNIRKDILRC